MKRWLSIIVSAGIVLATISAAAGEKAAKPAEKDTSKGTVIEMTVSPAAEPRPAMKYPLLPPLLDRTPGNAAPLVLKACLILKQDNVAKDVWEKIDQWTTSPLDKLPRDEVRKTLESFQGALHQAELGARRSECDWGLPWREEGNIYSILLPEVQETRNLARLLAVRARLQMAEGKLDEAIGTLGTGYALARHVAAGSTLVNGLVGIAIAGIMNAQTETLLQTPGAPNLYWSITALGDPFINMDRAYELEGVAFHLMCPEFDAAKKAGSVPELWQVAQSAFVAKILSVGNLMETPSVASPKFGQIFGHAYLAAAVPGSKKALIARGHSPKEVEAMTPSQVVMLQIFESFDEYRDECFKWRHAPYWQARAPLAKVDEQLKAQPPLDDPAATIGRMLPRLLLPAISNCRLVEVRSQRHLDVLRCIEAIRLYAAGHQGQLPKSLADISEVPVPINPVTGKAFPYRLEGDTALLDADNPGDDLNSERHYRIKIAK